VDRDGVKAGSIVDLHIDEQTEQPTWGMVRTGLLGSPRPSSRPGQLAEQEGTGEADGGGQRHPAAAVLEA
jgi:hypothetical protein